MRWNAFLMLAAIAAMAISPACAQQESETLRARDQSTRDIDAGVEAHRLLYEEAMRSCNFGERSTQYNNFDSTSNTNGLVTSTLKVKEWTGSCMNGVRDGKGTFRVLRRDVYPSGTKYETESVSEGTLVAGVPFGLWCTISENRRTPPRCALADGRHSTGIAFQKDSDGNWQVIPDQFSARPTKLPAGTLEVESDRMIAAARAGVPAGPLNISVTAPALTNLTQGASIRLGLKPQRVGLRGKRVALIYSDATLAAMKQFPLDVQAAIAASSGPGEASSRYGQQLVATATVTRFTQAIGAPLLRKGITVVPANDLSVLAKGQADYVLLVDWRYSWKSNLTEADYDAMPVCETPSRKPCDPIYKHTISMFLIGPGPALLSAMPWDYDVTKSIKSYSETDLISELAGTFGDFGVFGPTSGAVASEVGIVVDMFSRL